jgi:hypothetical protein
MYSQIRDKDKQAKINFSQVLSRDRKFTYDYDASILMVRDHAKLPSIALQPTSTVLETVVQMDPLIS